MVIKIALIIFFICISSMTVDSLYSKIQSKTQFGGFIPLELAPVLGVLGLLSFFVAIIGLIRQERRKSNASVEPIHTFTIKELNDEQFHNDFNKVPGGIEIGVQNTPRPQNHVLETQFIEGKEDLVAEDLAKIGIVADKDKNL